MHWLEGYPYYLILCQIILAQFEVGIETLSLPHWSQIETEEGSARLASCPHELVHGILERKWRSCDVFIHSVNLLKSWPCYYYSAWRQCSLPKKSAFFVFLSARLVSRSLSDNWHVCLWTPLTWEKEGWTEMRGWRMGQNARLIFIYNKLCNLFSWRELRLTNYHLLFSLHNIIKQQTKCC